MKLDKDFEVGIKMGFFVLGIFTCLTILFCLFVLAIKTTDNYFRENKDKDIRLWASKGCSVIEVKFNEPIYKCEEK